MRNVLKTISFAALSLAFGAATHAAELVKFKIMAPLYVDGKGVGIKQPEGVSCRGTSLFVADTGNGRVLRYEMTGGGWTPGAEILLPQLPSPIRVEASSKGEIFVLDGKLRKIARIAPSGEFQGYVDMEGTSPGMVVPRSFRIDNNDRLVVLDVFSARILVVDSSGKLQRQIPFPNEYGFFSDLSVDAGGNIYLIDSVERRVFTVAKDAQAISPLPGNFKDEVRFPTAIATDGKGNIFLVDRNGSGILIIGKDGSLRGRRLNMGWKDGFLRYPSHMCISENGGVFIADRGNNRIDIFAIVE